MSPRQAPRDLRASDADRDRVLALLAEAAGDGRLTAEEHAERVERACAARTLGELAELTADLAEPSAQPVLLDTSRVISGVFGPARREGRWVVPESLTVTAMFGEVEVDFTQAILQASRVRLYATVVGGRLRIVVPDGVSVVVTGHMVLARKRGTQKTPLSSAPDAAVIEVRGLVLGGEVIVRTPPRPRRFRGFRGFSRSLWRPGYGSGTLVDCSAGAYGGRLRSDTLDDCSAVADRRVRAELP